MSRLDPLFAPRGIAVVGASRDPGKLGAVMLRSLRPFGGPVAGINPRDAAPDVLRHLAADDRTRAVAMHVESVPDGPALVAAVRYLAERKPVAALVTGRSDVADFARSHTGALATSWRTTRAALRQAGAVVVDDERELADAVTALSALRLPPGAGRATGVVRTRDD